MSFSDEDKVTFAALALYDGGSEITADNLKTLITASGNTTAPYWPALFSGLLKGDTIEKIINTCGGGGSAGAAAPAAGAPAAAGDAPAKKEEKPKVEEVDALDGGMDMFGGNFNHHHLQLLFSSLTIILSSSLLTHINNRWRRRRLLNSKFIRSFSLTP